MKRSFIALALFLTPLVFAQSHLEVKYLRDSAEYATSARQVYRLATMSALDHASKKPRGSWAVVLDVDETTLDNSVYELDRGAYDLEYESASWAAWVNRAEAGNVPGVKEFLEAVRKAGGGRVGEVVGEEGGRAGGPVVFIPDRAAALPAGARKNLVANALMAEGDLLCHKSSKEDPRGVRGKSVATREHHTSDPQSPV